MSPIPFESPADVERAVPQVVEHLRAGGLLAYPTETVYGLGSRAVDGEVRKLAHLKKRPPGKPFLLLVSGRRMAEETGLAFSPAADALTREFWPGPLTLVLPGAEGRLPDALRGPEGGIAVRHTSHQAIQTLIQQLGEPLTSTSANRPGQAPPPGTGAIEEIFAEAIGRGELLVLDGGVLGNVPPSTLLDCTGERPKLVREGAIPRDELRARVGRYAP